MANITKCTNEKCKIKEECYRYTALANKEYQSYMMIDKEVNKPFDCDEFWDNEK